MNQQNIYELLTLQKFQACFKDKKIILYKLINRLKISSYAFIGDMNMEIKILHKVIFDVVQSNLNFRFNVIRKAVKICFAHYPLIEIILILTS